MWWADSDSCSAPTPRSSRGGGTTKSTRPRPARCSTWASATPMRAASWKRICPECLNEPGGADRLFWRLLTLDVQHLHGAPTIARDAPVGRHPACLTGPQVHLFAAVQAQVALGETHEDTGPIVVEGDLAAGIQVDTQHARGLVVGLDASVNWIDARRIADDVFAHNDVRWERGAK